MTSLSWHWWAATASAACVARLGESHYGGVRRCMEVCTAVYGGVRRCMEVCTEVYGGVRRRWLLLCVVPARVEFIRRDVESFSLWSGINHSVTSTLIASHLLCSQSLWFLHTTPAAAAAACLVTSVLYSQLSPGCLVVAWLCSTRCLIITGTPWLLWYNILK